MGILKDIQEVGAITRSPATLDRRILKATEELGELAEAALSATSASNAKKKNWMDVIDEACDVAIMGIDIAMTRPPGYESMSDEAWREVVKKIFALKLKKWQTQVKHGRTLIPLSELPVPPVEDQPTKEYVDSLAGLEYGFLDLDELPPSRSGGDIKIRCSGDEPFPEPEEGCGKTIGHGQKCGYGILCLDCDSKRLAENLRKDEPFVEDPESGLIARESTVKFVQEN